MTHRRYDPLKLLIFCVAFDAGILAIAADQPARIIRPITEAESALAVYYQDWGRASSGEPAIIFAAWPDGHIVWSDDPLKGGAPYSAGRIEPKKVAALFAAFDKDGIFAQDELNNANFGPDSQFITVFIKSGKKQIVMQSWHELFEENGRGVDQSGIRVSDNRPRFRTLREATAKYLFIRLVWSDTRAKLSDLIPCNNQPSAGRPVMKAGVLSWHEPTTGLNSLER